MENKKITVLVNNNATEVEEGVSVEQLLDMLDEAPQGLAVAINDQIVRKADWSTRVLNDKDNILLIKAAYGG